MSNLLVEIGNTALKAAWSDKMTLGKTFRYQGEKVMDFIVSLTRREKPAVMVVSSVYTLSEADVSTLREECGHLLVLDSSNKETLLSHGLPAYLSYDRAAAILAARQIIVDGAVGMAQMAIGKLETEGGFDLDDERKVNMINNIMVSIITDKSSQPVINVGSMY